MEKFALIVDDDRTERRLIAGILRQGTNLNSIDAENGRDALRILNRENDIALVILDLEMPIMGGMETLAAMQKSQAHIPVIVMTGSTDSRDAVAAMKSGAVDFLSKPVESARLDVSARNALKMSIMTKEIMNLRRRSGDMLKFSDLIGHDQGLKSSIKIARKAAACALPVLITGETGTGKEMLARSIHGESDRQKENFIAINCGAIPEKLVESTLFGHEKGAFTGAVNKAAGKFQEADGGTIFLDEVGELPREAQVKLLRVLQDGEVEAVGAGKSIPVDVRIISATNRDLSQEVDAGRFREDLFFRLNVLHIDMPPLRLRRSDISAMAKHFIEQFCSTHHSLPKEIHPKAMEKLDAYNWPGNVRELENVINRAMALQEEDILDPSHFSFVHSVANHTPPPMAGSTLMPLRPDGTFKSYRELEQEIVKLALRHHNNNITMTARTLGIAKSTLYTKIETLTDLKSA